MAVSWSAWGLVCISGCDIWGVVGIKCAGRNDFNTNHFQTSLILGFLKPSLSPYGSTFCNGPSTTGNRWRTRFCWGFRWPLKALLEAAQGQWEVCQLWLHCSGTWQNPLRQYAANRKAGGSSWRLAAIKSPGLRRRCRLSRCPLQKLVLRQQSEPFWLENWLET